MFHSFTARPLPGISFIISQEFLKLKVTLSGLFNTEMCIHVYMHTHTDTRDYDIAVRVCINAYIHSFLPVVVIATIESQIFIMGKSIIISTLIWFDC